MKMKNCSPVSQPLSHFRPIITSLQQSRNLHHGILDSTADTEILLKESVKRLIVQYLTHMLTHRFTDLVNLLHITEMILVLEKSFCDSRICRAKEHDRLSCDLIPAKTSAHGVGGEDRPGGGTQV